METALAVPAATDAVVGPAEKVRLSPIQFAVVALKKRLYKWQAFVLADVAACKPTVCVTPNESGKTSIVIASLALWCLHEWPGSTVVVTSATLRAVRTQVFAALEEHQHKFAGWQWKHTEIEDACGGRIVGFATDTGAKFEGFHARPGRPLLIIFDEAKTVADDIFEAADRCNPTMQLYVSSPGGVFGRFHDAFKNPRYAKHEIEIEDCPHITPERIAAMKEQYGEESDIYRSMILGKFAKGTADGKVVAFDAYERCAANPPLFIEGERRAFCDFAVTSDECVVATCDGNRMRILDAWIPDGNTAAIAERFERHLRELDRKGYRLRGDADGVGHGYITTLNLRGIPITGVNNNDKPRDPHYTNLAAEQWWTFAKGVRDNRWILPQDEVLKRQLCSRDEVYREVDGKKVFGREDGRLQLMPKKKLNTKSPDRADALVGAAFDYPGLGSVTLPRGGEASRVSREFPDALPSRWQEAKELEEAEQMAGFNAGA